MINIDVEQFIPEEQYSSLPLPFFIWVIFYRSLNISVLVYADFLHVRVMDRDIYTINILLKNKSDVKFSLHTTATFLLNENESPHTLNFWSQWDKSHTLKGTSSAIMNV